MAKKKKLIDKKVFKAKEGKCRVCGISDYSLLDVHRIIPGCENGEYIPSNSVSLCSNCHRKVHDGKIIIHRYYLSSSGSKLLHIFDNGEEKFV